MENNKLCIMPEMPYCPACKYGYIVKIDETECEWHCTYDGCPRDKGGEINEQFDTI